MVHLAKPMPEIANILYGQQAGVLPDLLPIRLPVKVSGKTVEDCLNLLALASTWETQIKFQAPGLAQHQPDPLGSKPQDRRYLCVFPLLSVALPFKAIHKPLNKEKHLLLILISQ